MIYFIQAENGLIKIGYTSTCSYERLKALQTGSPLVLELLATADGSQRLETQLHRKFKNDRVRGEWFRPSEELLEIIKKAQDCENIERLIPSEKPGPKPKIGRDLSFYRQFRSPKFHSAAKLAEEFGYVGQNNGR